MIKRRSTRMMSEEMRKNRGDRIAAERQYNADLGKELVGAVISAVEWEEIEGVFWPIFTLKDGRVVDFFSHREGVMLVFRDREEKATIEVRCSEEAPNYDHLRCDLSAGHVGSHRSRPTSAWGSEIQWPVPPTVDSSGPVNGTDLPDVP